MAVASAVIGLGGSAYQIIDGAQKKRAAEKELESLNRPEATNAFGGLQVSTLGSDLQREELARNTANSIDAARSAGTRGVIGAIPRALAVNTDANARIAAGLDEQQKYIDRLKANDNIRIQNQAQDYYINDLNALSSQYNAANTQLSQGIGNGVSTLGNYFNSMDFAGFTPQVDSAEAQLAGSEQGASPNAWNPSTGSASSLAGFTPQVDSAEAQLAGSKQGMAPLTYSMPTFAAPPIKVPKYFGN